MEIKIESLATIHDAAKKFIDNIGNNKVFAFYGKWELEKRPSPKPFAKS